MVEVFLPRRAAVAFKDLEVVVLDRFLKNRPKRVIAGTVMFPIIVGLSMVVGVAAGWMASVSLLDLSTPEFLKGLRLFFDTFDVQYGMVKAASFGMIVTWIGCMQGTTARGGAEGVGRAATSAVVYSAVMVLVLDAFWAVVWLLGRRG